MTWLICINLLSSLSRRVIWWVISCLIGFMILIIGSQSSINWKIYFELYNNKRWHWWRFYFVKESFTTILVRPRVVDLSFIVARVHQKIKALFCRINFHYYEKFCVKKWLFFFLVYIKKKYTRNSIVLQNLLNAGIYPSNFDVDRQQKTNSIFIKFQLKV